MNNSEIQRLENEFLSDVKNADIFTVVNGWEVLNVSFGYKSARVVLGLEGHSDYTLDFVYDGYGKKDELRTNVAACGSFNLCESSAAFEYYKAVGSLLNHKWPLEDLKKTMKEYVVEMAKLEKEED